MLVVCVVGVVVDHACGMLIRVLVGVLYRLCAAVLLLLSVACVADDVFPMVLSAVVVLLFVFVVVADYIDCGSYLTDVVVCDVVHTDGDVAVVVVVIAVGVGVTCCVCMFVVYIVVVVV